MKIQFLSSCIVLGSPCLAGEIRDVAREQADGMIRNGLAKQVSQELAESDTNLRIEPDKFDIEIAKRDAEDAEAERQRQVEMRKRAPARRAVTKRDA